MQRAGNQILGTIVEATPCVCSMSERTVHMEFFNCWHAKVVDIDTHNTTLEGTFAVLQVLSGVQPLSQSRKEVDCPETRFFSEQAQQIAIREAAKNGRSKINAHKPSRNS